MPARVRDRQGEEDARGQENTTVVNIRTRGSGPFAAWSVHSRMIAMWPRFREIALIVAAAPLLLLLWGLGHNEYLFGPGYVDLVALAVIAGGVAWRLRFKKSAHTVLWLFVALCVYNAAISIGGFVFRPWLSVVSVCVCAAIAFGLWRKKHIAIRVGWFVVLASFTGFFLLHFFREIDFDERFGRCRNEETRLDPVVRVIDRVKHPYDFVLYEPPAIDDLTGDALRPWVVGAVGVDTFTLRWFDPDAAAFVRLTPLSGWQKVQRLALSHDGRLVYGAPWGNRGQREFVLAVDPRDPKDVSKIPVENCRNVYELMTDPATGRLWVLCETSHNLVALDGRSYEQLAQAELPGLDAYDIALDPDRRRLFVTDYWSPTVTVLDADTLAFVDSIRVGWSSFGAAVWRDRLYVARPLASEVVEIDLASLKVLREIPVGYGVRDLEIDARRAVLYAGNYFDGTVDAIDIASGNRLKRAIVGQLVRGLMFDSARDRLWIATGCGTKVIEPACWLDPVESSGLEQAPACVQGTANP